MSAVWRAARAAVRRRRLQTGVIGLVVLVSSMTIVVALGLLDAASAPFDHAFARQQGSQLTATFDTGKVSAEQLARSAHAPGVVAVAGPFPEAVAELDRAIILNNSGPVTVVGRPEPGGSPVDRVNLWAGRWATGPGEAVFSSPPGVDVSGPHGVIGQRITLSGVRFTIVGLASSVSQTADVWVAPDQIPALHPDSAQLLYRFSRADSAAEVAAGLRAVTAGLPSGALSASQSYLDLERRAESTPNSFVPFLMVFGILGLLVAALIVGNVVSGAVVSGFRHIGMLKALGFTPNQVVTVYLVMVSVPALLGCLLGTALGDLAEQPLLHVIFNGLNGATLGDGVGLSPWVDAVTLLGVPALVLLAALIPALRARSLPAARAISAGSAQQRGRALRIQRALTGSRLPRAVSLGLGMPFARPGRSLLTLAAVVLGVATITFTTGLATTVTAFGNAVEGGGAYQVVVDTGRADIGMTPPTHTDPQITALLAALPGTVQVTPSAYLPVRLAGLTTGLTLTAYRGTSDDLGHLVVKGRWFAGPGEIVVTPGFLSLHAYSLGSRLTLRTAGREEPVTVVGEVLSGDPDYVFGDWTTATAVHPGALATQYLVKLAPGTDADRYLSAVRAADPGLRPSVKEQLNAGATTVIGSASVLTLLLSAVAALGVLNTVVLNTRERRRDLGMLKSIGMTPRQVVAMTVTSMAALGLLGGLAGLPLGILASKVVLPLTGRAGGIDFPASMTDVWHPGNLALLLLSGAALAALGALLPARSASRLTIAAVLHNE